MGGNVLGVRLRYAPQGAGQAGPGYEVVGIVREASVVPADRDFLYHPASAANLSPLVVGMHVRGSPVAFEPRLRELAKQVDPGLRLYDLLPLDEVMRRHNA